MLFLVIHLSKYYWLTAQIKRTGRPITVQVIAKKRGHGKSPARVTVLFRGRKIIVETRDKAFFYGSDPGQTAVMLKRDDADLLVPPKEPTTGAFVLIVGMWICVGMLLYVTFTNSLTSRR